MKQCKDCRHRKNFMIDGFVCCSFAKICAPYNMKLYQRSRWKLWAAKILLITLALLSGCTTVEYGGAKYMSIGGKEFESLKITKDKNGDITIEINKLRKEGISDVVEGVVRGTLKAVAP